MLLDPELHYLDNAATTMVDPEIAGAIHEALLRIGRTLPVCTNRR